ncbi:MAG: glycine cleavage T C-terminal barrel domain-containing protein [Actinomycetaceae bacterium]|nr:glycine cleavage T C-terminal barrel domain-containing protein [Actinomycetaceae bacterium]
MSKSRLLNLPRAVEDSRDAGIAAHYGDLSGEQWRLETGEAISDFDDLDIVGVTGPDRLSWLTTLSSQIVTDMVPTDSRELLLLDNNGRINFAAAVKDDGERTLLLVEGGTGAALIEFLERMKFMLRVTMTDLSDQYTVLGEIIPDPEQVDICIAERAQLPGYLASWVDPWPGVTDGGATYSTPGASHPGDMRTRVFHILTRDRVMDFTELWRRRENGVAGRNAWEALRIEDHRPRLAREVDERTLPHEVDWLRTAVHLTKGCYCGQETVARIVNLGKPPRRLVLLQLDGSLSRQAKPGDDIEAGGRRVGAVTSVARHADLGPIALGLVRRSLAADTDLDVITEEGPIAAAQEIIVDPQGKSSASPDTRPGAELRGSGLAVRKPQ